MNDVLVDTSFLYALYDQKEFAHNGTTILNSNDCQISMDKHFQVNYQLKSPLSPQPPYPHCV